VFGLAFLYTLTCELCTFDKQKRNFEEIVLCCIARYRLFAIWRAVSSASIHSCFILSISYWWFGIIIRAKLAWVSARPFARM
jgi:hypothetical protein